MRQAAGVGVSVANDCGADRAQLEPAEEIKPVEEPKPPTVVEPILSVPTITAGSAQVDHDASGNPGARAPIASRVTAGRLSATLVTGGAAVLLLQSSLWTSLVILGLPFWQHVDLLPIVDAAADDEGTTDGTTPNAEEERAVIQVLDARGPQGDGGAG